MTLIDRLSKLDGPDREVDGEIMQTFDPDLWAKAYILSQEPCGCSKEMATEEAKWRAPRYTASVDAAIALAERVLPGWVFDNVGQDFHSVPGGYEAFGWNVELINGTRVQGQAPTLPIAICIALLRAKEALNG